MTNYDELDTREEEYDDMRQLESDIREDEATGQDPMDLSKERDEQDQDEYDAQAEARLKPWMCQHCGLITSVFYQEDHEDFGCDSQAVAGFHREKTAAEARAFLRSQGLNDLGDRLYIALTYKLTTDTEEK